MLARKNRLGSGRDFIQVKAVGRTYSTPLFSLVILVRRDFSDPRFGFIVSRKFDKRAVVRNYARRRLQALVGADLAKFPDGTAAVFYVRSKLKEATDAQLSATLDSLLPKISFS